MAGRFEDSCLSALRRRAHEAMQGLSGTFKSAFCVVLLAAHSPAGAAENLAGMWEATWMEDWQNRNAGPNAVDFLGFPINDDARARALSYSTAEPSMLDRLCIYYPPTYILMGPFGFRLTADIDPQTSEVTAYRMSEALDRAGIVIHMNAAAQPAEEALHTFGGFTRGEWRGNTLTTHTTHFKHGYLQRNGVPLSDLATLTMHFTRHGELLSVMGIIEDPVYLTEPYAVSRIFRWDPTAPVRGAMPCTQESEDGSNTRRVPHYLPGANPFTAEVAKRFGIEQEAVLGGARTMYPEFSSSSQAEGTAPVCKDLCCGWLALAMGDPGPEVCRKP